MTRLTSDERRAIELSIGDHRTEILRHCEEILRLQAMLAAQPAGSDGDTIRLLVPLCSCGLPLDHRHPVTGEPRPCADETSRIALDETRSRPPVPASSVTRDETPSYSDRCVLCPHVATERTPATLLAALVAHYGQAHADEAAR